MESDALEWSSLSDIQEQGREAEAFQLYLSLQWTVTIPCRNGEDGVGVPLTHGATVLPLVPGKFVGFSVMRALGSCSSCASEL